MDDGKSTLLGRLLYDTKSIFEDQLETIRELSTDKELDLALLTDGLRAEREQKITIDVAYRYFTTPNRKFILADTPGHFQYTRNMITGCSTAELAIILIDARKGVTTQSRRHGFLASLLKVPHLLVAINKMDLVDYDINVFRRWRDEYREFAERLQIHDVTFIPISALEGDNVVKRSRRMPWYQGPTLLHHLESVKVGSSRNLVDFRFPVQYVVRPNQDFRGLAGTVYSGRVRPGDEVTVLPSGLETRIRSVWNADDKVEEAIAGDSVVLTLEDEVDAGRGDMIVRRRNVPRRASRLDAMLCWMSGEPLQVGGEYWLQHTTRRVKAYVEELVYRMDVDTLSRQEAETLNLNDIGRVVLRTTEPLHFDEYALNRATGNFILIDPASNNTVGAGMLKSEAGEPKGGRSSNVVWESAEVTLEERGKFLGHGSQVLWFTGLSGSGKSTLARALERRLFQSGHHTFRLDGDNLRHGLNGDLGFSDEDRGENLRRAAESAKLAAEHGQIVIASFITPLESQRKLVRDIVSSKRLSFFHVKCPLEVCRERDPKGLYEKAARGEIKRFTGLDAPFEEPLDAEVLDSSLQSVDDLVEQVLNSLRRRGILRDGT